MKLPLGMLPRTFHQNLSADLSMSISIGAPVFLALKCLGEGLDIWKSPDVLRAFPSRQQKARPSYQAGRFRTAPFSGAEAN